MNYEVKEYTFRNMTDAVNCAERENGILGHNANYTEWYVHVTVRK